MEIPQSNHNYTKKDSYQELTNFMGIFLIEKILQSQKIYEKIEEKNEMGITEMKSKKCRRNKRNRFERPEIIEHKKQNQISEEKDEISKIPFKNQQEKLSPIRNPKIKKRKFQYVKQIKESIKQRNQKQSAQNIVSGDNNNQFVSIENLIKNLEINKHRSFIPQTNLSENTVLKEIKDDNLCKQKNSKEILMPKGSKYCKSQYQYEEKQEQKSIYLLQNINKTHFEEEIERSFDHFNSYNNDNDPFDSWMKDKLSSMRQWKQSKLNNRTQTAMVTKKQPIKKEREFYLPKSKNKNPSKSPIKTNYSYNKTFQSENKQNIL